MAIRLVIKEGKAPHGGALPREEGDTVTWDALWTAGEKQGSEGGFNTYAGAMAYAAARHNPA